MEEKVSFENAQSDRVTIVKVKFEDGLPPGIADRYDWRVKVDSTKDNIGDELSIWETQTMNALLRASPKGFTIRCSDWVIVPKVRQEGYDTCCAILITVESKDPGLFIHLNGDGTVPCSIQ